MSNPETPENAGGNSGATHRPETLSELRASLAPNHPLSMLMAADLSEDQYGELEAIVSRAVWSDDHQKTFRGLVRLAVHKYLALSSISEGGLAITKASAGLDEDLSAIDKAVAVKVKHGFPESSDDQKALSTLRALRELIPQAVSKKSVDPHRRAVRMFCDAFGFGAGKLVSELKAGAKESPNPLCMFVQKALAFSGKNLGHDQVREYVAEALRESRR